MNNFQDKVSFIWSVAELLRGDFRQSEYGKVILPLIVLRRFDCVLEPTKKKWLAKAAEFVFPLSPREKQQKIADHLEQITKLQESRQTLISTAVTGKIDLIKEAN